MIYAIAAIFTALSVIGAVLFSRRLSREREREKNLSMRLGLELQRAAAQAGPMRDHEFRIAFATQRDAANAAAEVRKNAYRVTARAEESTERWLLRAGRRMTDSAANTARTYFETIAGRHGGSYEGSTAPVDILSEGGRSSS